MPNIKNITIENFKAFKHKTSFDIAPITLLIGPNGSGKSAFTSAFEFLKVNNNFFEDGFSNIQYVDEHATGLINKYNKEEIIKISLQIAIDDFIPKFFFDNTVIINIAYKLIDNKYYKPIEIEILSVEGQRVFKYGDDTSRVYYDFIKQRFIEILDEEFYEIYRDTILNSMKSSNYDSLNQQEIYLQTFANYIIRNSKKEKLTDSILSYKVFLDAIEESFSESLKNSTFKFNQFNNGKFEINDTIFQKNSLFLFNYEMLIIDIMNPVLDYLKEVTKQTNRNDLTLTSDNVFFYKEYPQLKNNLHLLKDLTNSFKTLGYNYQSNVIDIPGIGFKLEITKNEQKYNIADIGFGFSKLIPIMLQAKTINKIHHYDDFEFPYTIGTKEYQKYIIEEPEVNLHPALQSKLADFFVKTLTDYKNEYYKSEYYKFGNTLINFTMLIETHSEYMVRKFQYLVAKGELSPDDIVIHYFNHPDDPEVQNGTIPHTKQIHILKDGSLSAEFGKGFYDEADNIAMDLFNMKFKN